mmetsp:Transcript_34000/g.48312  ORF Transcript_34000/g.48312 Transcript_34000/m.48312 type:complete len:244 (-) Transcript_34000:939-1670(-)|eukprot:CAMPEP_0202464698 /NCGR_PEP_ID=MMETSP1360-20130828/62778_1 /ASSEMBLY_ACC=CAM_ASM_000848 /TAXON_ID=515479 /ORGANISM="Licmophora paradoxa, Strain CCMP2313" /LENGTH=243 /DNA_ID=CAMNT_0049088113 /DNA_START=51 /DNA_END=782 /DNA_ORIENTATION=+
MRLSDLVFILSFLKVSCFVSNIPIRKASLTLFAKARSKVNKNSSGGAGFGGKANTDKNSNRKVRAVSGFQGSGTKPLRQAANTFDQLRKDYGVESCNDVYVRAPLNDEELFWYVGKVARCSDESKMEGTSLPTAHEAVISQKRLILEYAKRELRPQNLSGPFSEGLELWIAPGDSEMDAVQNKVSFDKVGGSLASLSDGFNVNDVGYNPEIYVGDEVHKGGLRVKRDIEGNPLKPAFEVNQAV